MQTPLPLPGGAGRPKFNPLEMVDHYLYLQTQFGEDRCTQYRVIVVTDPQTNAATHPQTGPITLHCTAASAQCYLLGHLMTAGIVDAPSGSMMSRDIVYF